METVTARNGIVHRGVFALVFEQAGSQDLGE